MYTPFFIYLNHVCAKVYQIWVSTIKTIIGDREVETSEGQFIGHGNDVVRIWLFTGDNIK